MREERTPRILLDMIHQCTERVRSLNEKRDLIKERIRRLHREADDLTYTIAHEIMNREAVITELLNRVEDEIYKRDLGRDANPEKISDVDGGGEEPV